jgi:protein-disulfide isomerase
MRAILIAVPWVLALAAVPAFSEDSPPAAPVRSPSLIERRLERLEQGQQQLLKEVSELRKLLEEKSSITAGGAARPRPAVIPLDVRGEPFRGQSNARVAIVEYSSFACPYCAQYVREVYPLIDTNYVKPGTVKYFFRDLAEPGDTNALAAACSARCAGEQGKFWDMHDLLFAAGGTLSGPELGTYAQGLGLDMEKFTACLASDRWIEPILRSAAGARRLQLYGTPAFLIGTVSEDGNVVQATKTVIGGSFDQLKSVLDAVLTGESKPLALAKPGSGE